MYHNMNAIQQVWRITDLIKLIGSLKHDFEHNIDIEQINNTYLFQHLIPLIFYLNSESGIVKYNAKNGDRMRIQICKCNPSTTVIQFDLFDKRKRTPFYYDSILLHNIEKPFANQRILAEWVLNDQLLLNFCQCSGDIC